MLEDRSKNLGIKNLGIVVIGRNEGDRLRQCLLSVLDSAPDIIYVDSGSTDNSVAMAKSLGVEVLELDLTVPFTAARARNEGLTKLLQLHPELTYVQFVDGDCEVVPGWLEQAYEVLTTNADWVVVCGRRRERYPGRSLYNFLCDLEWNTPVGEAKACGGDAMMRVAAWQEVNGFDPSLIAGEESELCLRLRRQGGKIVRLSGDMTLHDAQMTRFGQWWQRSVRSGYAYAAGAGLHGQAPERHRVKETKSIWLWGGIVPAIALATVGLSHGWSLVLLFAYPLLVYKIYRYLKTRYSSRHALIYALNCVLIKFPQIQGQIQFSLNKLLGRKQSILEYKAPSTVSSK
ncbi:MAG: glycosyltransferase [Cyanobacteria bacterium P01_C01_bin.72]